MQIGISISTNSDLRTSITTHDFRLRPPPNQSRQLQRLACFVYSPAVFSWIGSKSVRQLLFVVLVWASVLIVELSLVRQYGTRIFPQNDEVWALYDAGTGIRLQWLWKTWAEHRIPLAKLIWKGILESTDYDFRAGNFLTVLGLGSLALAMIWTATKVRGRTIIADAFFPLALLNFGQAQVFLWWWQVNHVLAPITACLLLSVLVLYGDNLQPGQAGMIAI